MASLKQASSSQLTLGAFGTGNVVSLDGGKRIRLDDKVDFWPATGQWKATSTEDAGLGMTSMLAFLVKERERAGQAVPEPVPIRTPYVVTCNYCGKAAQLHFGKDVYPHRKEFAEDKFWVCWPCEAWVGCHAGGDGQKPLGTLANVEVRSARNAAHTALDRLWKDGDMSREVAYEWLAAHLGIPREECHIAMMGVQQCQEVIAAVEFRDEFR